MPAAEPGQETIPAEPSLGTSGGIDIRDQRELCRGGRTDRRVRSSLRSLTGAFRRVLIHGE